MEILDAIHTRRSIRQFIDRNVPQEKKKKILHAAMMAPSAGNAQPWQFLVLNDEVARVAAIHPYAAMASKVSFGIIVCGDESKEKFSGFWPQDCAAATMNILYAAHGLGLGAVWCGIYPADERVVAFRNEFGMPEGIIPFSFIPIGYPDEQIIMPERYDERRIHVGRW